MGVPGRPRQEIQHRDGKSGRDDVPVAQRAVQHRRPAGRREPTQQRGQTATVADRGPHQGRQRRVRRRPQCLAQVSAGLERDAPIGVGENRGHPFRLGLGQPDQPAAGPGRQPDHRSLPLQQVDDLPRVVPGEVLNGRAVPRPHAGPLDLPRLGQSTPQMIQHHGGMTVREHGHVRHREVQLGQQLRDRVRIARGQNGGRLVIAEPLAHRRQQAAGPVRLVVGAHGPVQRAPPRRRRNRQRIDDHLEVPAPLHAVVHRSVRHPEVGRGQAAPQIGLVIRDDRHHHGPQAGDAGLHGQFRQQGGQRRRPGQRPCGVGQNSLPCRKGQRVEPRRQLLQIHGPALFPIKVRAQRDFTQHIRGVGRGDRRR